MAPDKGIYADCPFICWKDLISFINFIGYGKKILFYFYSAHLSVHLELQTAVAPLCMGWSGKTIAQRDK